MVVMRARRLPLLPSFPFCLYFLSSAVYSQVSSQLCTDGWLTAGGERAERANIQRGAIHKRDSRNSTVGTLTANLGE